VSEKDDPQGPEKADLRYTEHQRDQVKVSRDLSGGGHLARGDKTNMSRLNFSARAKPRDDGERDRAFTDRPLERPAPAPAEAAPAAAGEAAPADDTAPADAPSMIQRVGKLFGL
jgi:hypothetical protein